MISQVSPRLYTYCVCADWISFGVIYVSSLRLWDVSDAKKHLQVIKAKDKQGIVQPCRLPVSTQSGLLKYHVVVC